MLTRSTIISFVNHQPVIMSKMNANTDENPLTEYKFPVPPESLYLMYSGAVVNKAVLEANGCVLSVIKLDQRTEFPDTAVEFTDIPFFNETPFHAGLAKDWGVEVKLYTWDLRIPSLTIRPADKTLLWEDLPGPIYEEPVVVHSKAGQKKLTLVYTPTHGGYKE